MRSLGDFRKLPVAGVDIAARHQAALRWFIVNWIDGNVHPLPLQENLGIGIAALVEQWVNAARSVGITADDIEAETGYHPVDLLLTAFLARWNPQNGGGGLA